MAASTFAAAEDIQYGIAVPAVSYTHLDVYKRQTKNTIMRGISVPNTIIGPANPHNKIV